MRSIKSNKNICSVVKNHIRHISIIRKQKKKTKDDSQKSLTKAYLNDLIYKVNGAAIEIHKALGPGLLESVYHKCMKHELQLRNINYVSELEVPISYKNLDLEVQLRCDLFVENVLVVELKATHGVLPIHEAQVLTYMKLLQVPKGLLINFNCTNIFSNGQRTFVNELYKNLQD